MNRGASKTLVVIFIISILLLVFIFINMKLVGPMLKQKCKERPEPIPSLIQNPPKFPSNCTFNENKAIWKDYRITNSPCHVVNGLEIVQEILIRKNIEVLFCRGICQSTECKQNVQHKFIPIVISDSPFLSKFGFEELIKPFVK
jgi:hypothetical protein